MNKITRAIHKRQTISSELLFINGASDPGLFGFLVRAGVRAPPLLLRVLPGHLHARLPPLLLFGLLPGELGLYLGRVDVGVEVGHEGEDAAHHQQQGGEEDVLGPLVDGDKHAVNREGISSLKELYPTY